jgi:enoyl-CoA hydratase/carnithine racemase
VTYEQIATETRGRVGIIRLNRPEKLNAWTDVMGAEIQDSIRAWNSDDSIGAIVLTGEGRAFCAGADLGGFAERAKANASTEPEQIRRGGAAITHFLQKSKPIVAAVNGYAVGIGLTLVLPATCASPHRTPS